MRYRNLLLVTMLAGLMNGCDVGMGPIDLNGASVHFPFAEPGGPYDDQAGQPMQFDGSGSFDDKGHTLSYEWNFGDGGTATLAMPIHTYAVAGTYTVTLRVCESASVCSVNSGSTAAVIASPENASAGGIWIGSNSEGDQIFALITETGRFHLLDEFEFQGSGILTVSPADDVTAGFRMVSPPGGSFADGSIFAECSFDGLILERATLDGSLDCATTGGSLSSVTANLSYQALYEVDSSLAAFGGTWTDSSNPGGDVANIDAMGAITGQDGSGSGCIYSGQVSIINPDFNVYDIEWTYSSCVGQAATLNDVTFSGVGAIDNTVSPMGFVLVATGVVQFNEVSLVLFYEET